jgi:aryl-alcohol dehydrogenase-like predicted oxidoreductase
MSKRRIECSIGPLSPASNFIDTADIYSPGAESGTAELLVGRWLGKKRAEVILVTKGGGKMGPAAWSAGNSRRTCWPGGGSSLSARGGGSRCCDR